jgi:Tfp pilus assembly protein PilF
VIVELPQKTSVEQQVTRSQAIDQYYAKIPFLSETVETHLKVAEVCQLQGLEQLAREHYQRVFDIDAENQTARKALNQRKVDGEWISLDNQMNRQGYVKNNRGIWVTRQQQLISERSMQFWKRQSDLNRTTYHSGIPQAGQIRISDFDARRGNRDGYINNGDS